MNNVGSTPTLGTKTINMSKILSISKKVPKEVILPDGYYQGTWGGYCITVRYNGSEYELKTEEGVRGIGIKVVVTIQNGEASFKEIKN